MAGVKELDDVSSAIMCMDTLAMDSMDMPPEAFRNVEARVLLTGAQSKGGSNADSDAAEKAQQDKDGVHEIEDSVGTVAREVVFDEAKESGYDHDEGLMTFPGIPDTLGSPSFQEVFPENDHELDKIKDLNMDIIENDSEEGIGFANDGGLLTDPCTPETAGTPGTPQEEIAQGVHELNETNDIHLDWTEDDLEEEHGSDYEALDSDPGTSQEEAAEDVNELDETEYMHVVGAEYDLEVLDEGEKPLDNDKFLAPFPITRVKRIIKLDKDVRLVSSDAITLVAQSTALFVQSLSSASFTVMLQTKRKTIRGSDVVLAAMSTRQFRECLSNDLAILLEESNEVIVIGKDGLVEKGHGTGVEPVKKKPQWQKSAKKHQLAPTPGRQPITNFFKA